MADGERIAVLATFEAWRGEKRAKIMGNAMIEVRDGQIVEAFNHWDWLSLLDQYEEISGDKVVHTLEELATNSPAST